MQNSPFQLITTIHSLSRAKSLDDVMTIMGTATRALTGADGATFVLRDGDYCFYADENAIGPLWKGRKFPLSTCVSGWAMLNKKAAVIPDIFDDPRVPVEAYRPTFVKSLVMVPMREESPIGAIGNYWARNYTATPEQIELLQALADTAAVALENIRLCGDLQRQIDELGASNRAKDEFLMMVSHELRTPLSAIQGWAQLFLRGGLSEEELRKGAETIVRNTRLQTVVVEEIVDASMIMNGRMTLKRQDVDLGAAMTKIIGEFFTASMPKSLRHSIELPAIRVWGDEERLLQVGRHLVSNAVKFTPSGGQVEVSLKREGPSAVLKVADSGEGISAEFMPHLFNRFRQADASITRKHGGLGLGLAISRHIVETLGGQISATSDGAGKGSTFTVHLPLANATSA